MYYTAATRRSDRRRKRARPCRRRVVISNKRYSNEGIVASIGGVSCTGGSHHTPKKAGVRPTDIKRTNIQVLAFVIVSHLLLPDRDVRFRATLKQNDDVDSSRVSPDKRDGFFISRRGTTTIRERKNSAEKEIW